VTKGKVKKEVELGKKGEGKIKEQNLEKRNLTHMTWNNIRPNAKKLEPVRLVNNRIRDPWR
jgi:hypothetical protein